MVVYNNILAGAAGSGGDAGYKIERSLRFNPDDSSYLSQTFSGGNRTTWTLSFWYKPSLQGTQRREIFVAKHQGDGTDSVINFRDSDNAFEMYHYQGGSLPFQIISEAKFRDPSAWYHFVIAYDTTIASPAADRIKVWCNGVRIESWATSSFPSHNFQANWNDNNVPHTIGREGSNYLAGYLAEIHYVEGATKAETDFGEYDTNGVWNPIEYTGSHNISNGVNGFHLNFSDSSTNEALGFDSAPTTPDPDPKKGMDIVTYDGNGGTQNIGGLNFEPGLVWLKTRTGHSGKSHGLFDVVRGPTKFLSSDSTAAENSSYNNNLTSFNPDGFTIGDEPDFNTGGRTYVGWCWRAGGPAIANTDGSVTSQVSASTDYGFSVVTWTGTGVNATIGHGLNGKTPKFIILKARTATSHWQVFHTGIANNQFLELSSTGGPYTNPDVWNSTDPTGSVFSVISNSNASSTNYVAYCWSEVPGYSKFSSYTGNGSSTGPVVTTGFKPKWLMIKSSTVAGAGWYIWDSERDTSNPRDKVLRADTSGAETSGSGYNVNFNDDGFQILSTADSWNKNGDTFLYMAFADRPGNNWDVNNIVTNEGLTTSKTQFDVVKYNGNGSSGRNVEGLSFTPDFVWVKNTTNTGGYNHILVDSVRGAGKYLVSNATNAESTFGYISAFNSGGFTVSNHTEVNGSSNSYVAWAWKAGGTAVSNTDGSITSSVSANAEYGFSIVNYTGTGSAATVGHGLNGKVPELIIVKNRDKTYNWAVWSSQLSSNAHYLFLNGTDSESNSYYTYWNNTAPTGSVFSIGANSPDTAVNVNESGDDMVAYCFANVPGYQRIGSYTGSGASGNTIVTGFRPAFVLIRSSSHGGDWTIYDAARGNDNYLSANKADAEENYFTKDFTFLSNGFVFEGNDNSVNASGRTYVYYAVAETPFKIARAR